MHKSIKNQPSGYIFDIKRYAIHDGPGIRTTVFFKGCPLRCRWCHNPESWKGNPQMSLRTGRCIKCGRCVETCPQNAITMTNGSYPVTDAEKCTLCGRCLDVCLTDAREIIGKKVTVSQVMAEVEKDRIFYDQSAGGVTFSGGEPLAQPEFLIALLDRCKAVGIHSAVDTACCADIEIIKAVSAKADMFLCDIKHFDNSKHKEYTDVDNSLILKNIKYLAQSPAEIIIRIPVIPGFNDDVQNVERTAQFVKSLDSIERIDILPYNSGGIDKSMRLTNDFNLIKTNEPDYLRMEDIKTILEKFGFKVKVGG